MDVRTFEPTRAYLTKSYVTIAIVAVVIMLFGLFIGGLVSLDEEVGAEAIWWTLGVTMGVNVLWGVPALILMKPYYRSLRYEIHEDEVIVHVGIITRSVKHVPFRTVTNITVKRGPLDRLFDIGSLEIQTAGMSGSSTEAEQQLVGLDNPEEIYDLVAKALRRFRGSMPTAADMDEEEVMQAILEQVREIRQSLEE